MSTASSKKLLKKLPPEQTMHNTLLGLLNNTDQAAAITGAAYLDHALQILIEACFRNLTNPENRRMFDGASNGILGSFSAKIRLAYASRIIQPKTYERLLLINDIRNAFAHTLHEVNFDHPLIVKDCAKLKPPISQAFGQPSPFHLSSKLRYMGAVLSIYAGLRENVHQQAMASALLDYSGKSSTSPKNSRKQRRAQNKTDNAQNPRKP